MHFSSTDLPEPEPPITTIEVPGGTSRSTPSSTTLSPKRFATPRRRILATGVLIGARSLGRAHQAAHREKNISVST